MSRDYGWADDPAIKAQAGKGYMFGSWMKPKRNDDALRSVTRVWAERLASAWASRPVTVLYESVGVGASTTTDQNIDLIYLDDAVLLPRSAQDLAAAVGVVVHELGHLRFTIKQGDIAAQWLVDQNLYRIFNMVEDAKEEMQHLTLRPGFEKYLKYAIVQHILKTVKEETIHRLYPLIAGRTYLPQALIDRSREFSVEFFGDDTVDRFDVLLADFLETDPRVEPQKVVDIIAEINELLGVEAKEGGCHLGDDGPSTGQSESGPPLSGDGVRSHKPKKGKSEKSKGEKNEDEKDEEEVEEEEELSEDEEENDWLDGPPDQDKDEDEDAEGDEEGDEDGDEEGKGDGEQSTDKGGSGASDKGTNQTPSTPTTPSPSTKKHLIEQMEKMKADLEQDLASSLEEDYQLIESEAFGTGNIRRPTADEITLQSNMVSALRRMTERAKGGLDRRRPKGRLNVRRFIQNRERADVEKTVYDKYRPNVADALNMEIILAVDTSGSTGDVIDDMAGTVWALVTALESVGGPSVTVITWDTDFKVVKVPTDKWRVKYVPTMEAAGGTQPLKVLRHAHKIMQHSRKKQKLMFMLTDGSWSSMEQNAAEIKQMRREDIDVYILGFGGFTVANLPKYGATDGSSGGSEEVIDFIFKIAEARAEKVLQAHGV